MSDSGAHCGAFTVPPRATRQCGRNGLRELKEELSEEQLQKVYGGKASFHDLNFVHKQDKASPVLMQA